MLINRTNLVDSKGIDHSFVQIRLWSAVRKNAPIPGQFLIGNPCWGVFCHWMMVAETAMVTQADEVRANRMIKPASR